MEGSTLSGYILTFAPLIALFLVMWLLIIRPQKKKENETQQMRNNIQAGDEIITIGGIIGKVSKVKDDMIVVQTGADKTKLEMTRWAVSSVTKKADASGFIPESQRAESEEEAAPAKRKRFVKKEEAEEPASPEA